MEVHRHVPGGGAHRRPGPQADPERGDPAEPGPARGPDAAERTGLRPARARTVCGARRLRLPDLPGVPALRGEPAVRHRTCRSGQQRAAAALGGGAGQRRRPRLGARCGRGTAGPPRRRRARHHRRPRRGRGRRPSGRGLPGRPCGAAPTHRPTAVRGRPQPAADYRPGRGTRGGVGRQDSDGLRLPAPRGAAGLLRGPQRRAQTGAACRPCRRGARAPSGRRRHGGLPPGPCRRPACRDVAAAGRRKGCRAVRQRQRGPLLHRADRAPRCDRRAGRGGRRPPRPCADPAPARPIRPGGAGTTERSRAPPASRHGRCSRAIAGGPRRVGLPVGPPQGRPHPPERHHTSVRSVVGGCAGGAAPGLKRRRLPPRTVRADAGLGHQGRVGRPRRLRRGRRRTAAARPSPRQSVARPGHARPDQRGAPGRAPGARARRESGRRRAADHSAVDAQRVRATGRQVRRGTGVPEEIARPGRKGGDPTHIAFERGNLARLDLVTGNLEEAHEGALAAVEMVRPFGNPWSLAYCLVHLARVALKRGDLDAAESALRESESFAARSGDIQALESVGRIRRELDQARAADGQHVRTR
ncbi:hypothetical protein [Micromonospora sp. MP36]|uniref:hypothetical protein n=1 Tax=unclassified Micromonospora TaxID=2617518 RepID=UPI00351AD9FF